MFIFIHFYAFEAFALKKLRENLGAVSFFFSADAI